MSAHNAGAIAESYLRIWNETDAARRASMLRETWSEDAHYVDPLMSGQGLEQISQLIAAVHQRFPGYRFSLANQPDGHGDHVRFSWALGTGDADTAILGSDVLQLRDGRVSRVIGFLDRVPA
ncbi:nuclear transport factor 2 family protein [Aquabacterium sp.]|uniref:nuclear transport factor 2 family protein n=1 Tax=Aquabacterium sp. TaxID=1872578 RepID=UPI002B5C922D|nr:nuclear transport factor 2 family protein [Aquabacterium sp.]HSW06876.1 nuclear transport factor 2 family protein [Aquabacterium sp.]